MRISYPLFEFKSKAIALTAASIIAVILLAANITITNAQQQQEQQQPSTSQPTTSSASVTQNGTTTATPTSVFQSAKDSFRVQLPEGWVIRDVNNTGFTLAAEVLQGYGVLAQLCPEGEEGGAQQQGALSSGSSCQQRGQEEVIHIIRYPNLDTRLGITVDDISSVIPPAIALYQIQKLQEVGYRDIEIVNGTGARININYTTIEGAPNATVPAGLIEMTYSTSSAPGEMRRGYFILTATNVTPPDTQTITGYSIFYEGTGANATEQITTRSGNLLVPSSFRQVTDSFELIASEEAEQAILGAIAQQAMGNEPTGQVEENGAGEDNDEEEDGEDGGE
jgi:hypothetical protein